MKKFKKKCISIILIPALILLLSFSQERKKLFLLGDSMALKYGGFLKEYLKDVYTIQRKGSEETALRNLDVPVDANGGDSRMVLSYLRNMVKEKDFHPDLLVLNCGAHDIKRDKGTRHIAVDSVEYRNNLEEIYTLLKKRNIPLIWVRSTEVVDSIHNVPNLPFKRFAADLEQYNRIADDVFSKHDIPIIDLYGFTKRLGDDRYADHVHYIISVSKLQAAYIAGFIINYQNNIKK